MSNGEYTPSKWLIDETIDRICDECGTGDADMAVLRTSATMILKAEKHAALWQESYESKQQQILGMVSTNEDLQKQIRELETRLQQVQDSHFDELQAATGDACAWQYWRDKARKLEDAQRVKGN